MTELSIPERLWITRLTADRIGRSAVSRMLYSPAFRWRYGAAAADQLLIVPQDLRTTDPSFWEEVALGQFGLAGTAVPVGDRSPFTVTPPNAAWARALNGFGWLRHLAAADQAEARETARRLATDWVRISRCGARPAWDADVTARRVISWISHSPLLLDGADARTYRVLTESLGAQLVHLAANWRSSPAGHPRLLALIAIVLADLTIARRERKLGESESALAAELSRQILPDGGHVSRNPSVLVEMMLDLLPLHQCFASRKRPAPSELPAAMQRMISMLKHMRLGDGMLARFNGTSVPLPAGLATVLAYDKEPGAPRSEEIRPSRYVRLERGAAVLIMDAGPPPPLNVAGEAHAGCLSFEMSSGTRLMFVNGGAPGGSAAAWRAAARATASHNTLSLAEKSSSRLIRHRRLERLVGAQPIRNPDGVAVRIEKHGGSIEVTAQHDGYLKRYRLFHRRTLALNEKGRRLVGIDRLESARGNLRLKLDLPFSIHFHLHPGVSCQKSHNQNAADIILDNGETWRFSLEGATLEIEESTFYADSAGPRRALQIVARGATFGETEVRWIVERDSDLS